jgi:hypothetical protein
LGVGVGVTVGDGHRDYDRDRNRDRTVTKEREPVDRTTVIKKERSDGVETKTIFITTTRLLPRRWVSKLPPPPKREGGRFCNPDFTCSACSAGSVCNSYIEFS